MNMMRGMLLSGLLFAGMCASALADTGTWDPDARVPSYYGQFGPRLGESVLVARDYLPWGGDAAFEFTALGANVTIIDFDQLIGWPLDDYCVVYVSAGTTEAGDPTEGRIWAALPNLDNYVLDGGVLFFASGTWGASYTLPGSAYSEFLYDDTNWIVDPGHPIAAGLPDPFYGGYASHDYWVNIPAGAAIVTDSELAQGPTTIVYDYGAGTVIALAQPSECYLEGGGCGGDNYPDMVLLWTNAAQYALNICDGVAEAEELAQGFHLGQNYPNPFNPSTTISFSVEQTGPVSLRVFDITGSEVATLVNGLVEVGEHSVSFDAGDLSSGAYIYSLESEGRVESRKMLLLK